MKTITATYFQKNYEEVLSKTTVSPQVITRHGKPRYILMSYSLLEELPKHLQALVTGEPIVLNDDEIKDMVLNAKPYTED